MRAILSLSALVLSVGVSAAPPRLAPALTPSSASNLVPPTGARPNLFRSPQTNSAASRLNCHGRIETAREERGLPKLQKDDAKPAEPLFIAAVDKMIDGCEVLVMRENLSDIRPLPEFQHGPGKLTPLGRQ
jgi:hypothetical protein